MTFDAIYERMSLEARAKLEDTFGPAPARAAFLQSFPPELVDSSGSPPQQLSPNEARRQLLQSLPLSPAETAQRETLAKLATTRSVPTPPLPTAKNIFSPSQFPSGSSVGMRQKMPPFNAAWKAFSLLVFCGLVVAMFASPGRQVSPGESSAETYVTTRVVPATTTDEFFRNQGFEPQAPFLSKELPGERFGQLEMSVFSADGKTLAVPESQNNRTHIYEVPSLRPLCVIPARDNGAGVKISADGGLLVMQTPKGIALWNAQNSKRKQFWLTQSNSAAQDDFDISPDGKYVVGLSSASTATVWSTRSGKRISQIKVPNSFTSLIFMRDSKRWISFASLWTDKYQIQLHEMKTEKVLTKSFQIPGTPYSRVISPRLLADTRLAVTSTGKDATFIDIQSLEVAAHYVEGIGPKNWPDTLFAQPLAWSPSARLVLCLARQNGITTPFIRRFDPNNGTFSTSAILLSNALPLGATFSPDNKTLYALNQNGQLLAWYIADLSWQ